MNRHRELHFHVEAGRIGHYDVREVAEFIGRERRNVLQVAADVFQLSKAERTALSRSWRIELKGRPIEFVEVTPCSCVNPGFGSGVNEEQWKDLSKDAVLTCVPQELVDGDPFDAALPAGDRPDYGALPIGDIQGTSWVPPSFTHVSQMATA